MMTKIEEQEKLVSAIDFRQKKAHYEVTYYLIYFI